MQSDLQSKEAAPPSEAAFAELVSPHMGRLLREASGILGCEHLAREAVQEALLALWLQGHPPENPRSWLIRAVIYRSLHLARTVRRRRKHERRASRLRSESNGGGDPSAALVAEETRREVLGAIAGLDGKHREVLSLHLIDGQGYESIARRLGVPIGTVRSRLNRARAAMQSRLG